MGIFLLVTFAVIIIFLYIFKKKQYEKTDYYQQTKNSYLNVRFNKGLLGEFCTYKYLKPLGGYKRYLFNLYIPTKNGETTELDVVLLHESGIYVLESKNYSGWIFGTENQQYWTQTLSTGKGRSQKNRFFNPILQNKGHLKWLQAFLADQSLPLYSYIVFSDGCEFKNITLTSGKHFVVKQNNLLSAIQQNASKAGRKLTSGQIDLLFKKLYPLTQVDEARKMMHIRNIQQKTQSNASPTTPTTTTANIEKTVCPRCGGKLVMRTAASGSRQGQRFWGCSNYPKCKYMKNLSSER